MDSIGGAKCQSDRHILGHKAEFTAEVADPRHGRQVGAGETCAPWNELESDGASGGRRSQFLCSRNVEAVQRLAGGVAHHFNTLLQVISINAEMARDQMLDGSPSRRNLDRIAKAAERAGDLTRRLLAFSCRQPLMPKAIDLHEFVMALTPMIERILTEAIAFEVVAIGKSTVVRVDPGELKSALLELVFNACDAMPEGGNVRIEIGSVTIPAEESGRSCDIPPGVYGTVTLADNGVGMAANIRDRAFEPFFTTKEVGEGAGLGLSIVYGFIRQSAGYVDIESTPNQGTKVAIRLPAAPADSPAASSCIELPRGHESLAVVTAGVLTRVNSIESLQNLGYRVIEARDGYEVLDHLAVDSGIKLLLIDIAETGGLDGKQLIEKARSIRPGLKIVCAYDHTSDSVDTVPALKNLDVEVLANPYSVDRLAWAIRVALDGIRPRRRTKEKSTV